MADVSIDADTTAFTLSGEALALEIGVTYTYWDWEDDEVITWEDGEWAYYTRAFQRNWDTTAYNYSTPDITFDRVYQINLDPATFSVTGSDVVLSDVNIFLDAGPYTLFIFPHFPVSNLPLEISWQLNADTAAFSVSTPDVQLDYSQITVFDVDTTSFSITGSNVTLAQGYQVDADTVAFSVTGGAATLEVGFTLDTDTASYSVTGGAVEFDLPRTLQVDVARYQLLGGEATFSKSEDAQSVIFSEKSSKEIIPREVIEYKVSYEQITVTVDAETVTVTPLAERQAKIA